MKVLLVEDDPFTLELFSHFLKEEGYEVTGCHTGEMALAMFLEKDYPFVITDIVMPGMDGLSLCREIRKSETGKYTIILGVTAHESPEMLQAVLNAGADDFIHKPDLGDDLEVHLLRIRLKVANRQVQNQLQRQLAEEALRKSEQSLREANATKDKFFSIIAHDLKEPFAGLIPMTEILAELMNDVEPSLKEVALNINRATRNTQKLLENLLDWARVQSNKIEFKPEDINLAYIILTNHELFLESAKRKEVAFEINVDDNIFVYADDKMVTTIIRNLVNNAIKFTRSGGKVTVAAEPLDDKFIKVSVIDTGVGIDHNGMRKIFRIDESHKTVGTAGEKGTGLGLILCKEFVEKNGGKINVESKIGAGSTFFFTLPKAKN